MTLKTRKPTGRVPWPLILIEGPEKSGKSFTAALLSASPRVGQTYWIDLGEGAADEYGAIPGARYLVVEHDGSWPSILGSVEAVRDEARKVADAGQPPVVLVIDSMTAEWDLLKDWISGVAAQRLARKGRRLEPGDDPKISMDLWNAANGRHRKLMTILMTFPGIVVITARGKEVAAIGPTGQPIEGSKEYKVEGQKNLAFDCSAWVRMSRENAPTVIGLRSVHAGMRPGIDKPKPAPNFSLEWLVFDVLRCDPATATTRDLVEAKPGTDDPDPVPAAPDNGGDPRPNRAPAVREQHPPAPRPSPRAVELFAGIDAAADLDALRTQYDALTVAATTGLITAAENDQLTTHVRNKKSALQPTQSPPTAANEPPMVTQAQHRHMHALWRELGVDGDDKRDVRLQVISEVVGRTVESSKQLAAFEADNVIAELKARKQQKVEAAR